MKKSNNIFYAWVKYQRRAASMQESLGYELNFIDFNLKKKVLKPLDYMLKSCKTLGSLIIQQPTVLWLQLPPSPLLYIALFYKKINKDAILIVDCHNGVFWGKWKKYLSVDKLNQFDIILVHNYLIKEIAEDFGLDKEKLVILEDKPAIKNSSLKGDVLPSKKTTVLMPCSFNADEPIDVVFEAASQIPEIDFLISGPKDKGELLFDFSKRPENVQLIGYLSLEDYERVFRSADAVLGLTTEDHIQLSVANEATGFEIPMVISDTPLLRNLFNKGAVYVETLNSQSIANGIKEALDNRKKLKNEVKELKTERIQKWEKMAGDLVERVNAISVHIRQLRR
ncbi:glycosyltransferase [Pedobacter chinensis]|uniref:Glycosyltransferase n=1 Tax=Pedobacter chinensis TaxID=2282421 RepID=A0A369PPR0_9SPHI|nr:glycosyltransferase [Pedobacter chinensis]RDC54272.1 glycosyltransferase [Pedobacter chinensis]